MFFLDYFRVVPVKREITANENSVFVDLFDSILTFLDRLFSSSVFINTQITLFIHLVEKT